MTAAFNLKITPVDKTCNATVGIMSAMEKICGVK